MADAVKTTTHHQPADEFDLDFEFDDLVYINARPRPTTADRLEGLYFDPSSPTGQKYIGNKPHMGMH